MIGKTSFVEEYRRLVSAYGRTFRDDQAEEYYRAIAQRLELDEWQVVIRTAMSECESFPPIKTLLGILYNQRRQRPTAPPVGSSEDGEGCPFCHGPRVVLILDTGRDQIEWDHTPGCRVQVPWRGTVVAREYPDGNSGWRRVEVS